MAETALRRRPIAGEASGSAKGRASAAPRRWPRLQLERLLRLLRPGRTLALIAVWPRGRPRSRSTPNRKVFHAMSREGLREDQRGAHSAFNTAPGLVLGLLVAMFVVCMPSLCHGANCFDIMSNGVRWWVFFFALSLPILYLTH